MIEQRDTIFISHATPEDNNFTIWLASRLQLLGYKVWIDKNALVGGEKFWETIDQVIRNQACKVILVYSNAICQDGQHGKLKDGIYKEYSMAESIGKQLKLDDFIVLANIDGAPYNLFIGADRQNQINFSDNWAQGLIQLQKKLTKDNVPAGPEGGQDEFNYWFQYQYVIPNPIVEKKELYYSNIWPVERLPEYFFIHEYGKEEDARNFYENYKQFPIGKISNYISAFEADLLYTGAESVFPTKIHSVRIIDMLMGDGLNTFPTNRDAQNHFKHLMKMIFHRMMKNRGMFWYEMSNKKLAYFYTPANLNQLKVRFPYPFRKATKMKNLLGTHKVVNKWHYALSCRPILTPLLGFSLKSHLTFTSDGFKVWKNQLGETDVKKIQSNRRSKGKMMFNEEWRDLFLGFLAALEKDGKIEIQISYDFSLNMKQYPEMFWNKFGYFDPKDKTRQGLLDTYEVDEEEENESTDGTDASLNNLEQNLSEEDVNELS